MLDHCVPMTTSRNLRPNYSLVALQVTPFLLPLFFWSALFLSSLTNPYHNPFLLSYTMLVFSRTILIFSHSNLTYNPWILWCLSSWWVLGDRSMYLGNNNRSQSPVPQRRPDTANNAITSSSRNINSNNNHSNNNTLASANLGSPASTRQQRASFDSPMRPMGTLSRQQSMNNTNTTMTVNHSNNNPMALMEGLHETDLDDYGGPLRLPPRPASAFNVTRPGTIFIHWLG